MLTETGKTVRELVLENPAAARVFEKLGIDYCCGGNKPLVEACNAAKLPVDDVVAALDKAEPVRAERDWREASLSELAQYIVDKHHAFTREEINRLEQLILKVVGVHGTNHPELLRVRTVFRELAQELTMHMMKEEHMLFPYIAEMETEVSRKRPVPPAMFGTVQNPVRMMMMEHDSAGENLHGIREATHGYALPADACASYKTLYQALEAFEADLHQHIHLENNILFPRAIQMEDAAS
jgi:regulator of cell morphogenesis and NO signaling